jgi:hypothetical protein
MARGINSVGDLVTKLADGTDINHLWTDYSAAVAAVNSNRSAVVNLLSFKTTRVVDSVLQSYTGDDFEDASEYGQPVGLRPDITHVELGYPFKWRDKALRYTWQFLANATKEQVDAVMNAALEADNKQVFQAVMNALFTNTTRTNEAGYTVQPLWRGAVGDTPPAYNGVTFADQHNHYVTTNNASLTQVSVDALMTLPREHGYGLAGNGQLVLFCNPLQADVIRGFRSTAGGGSGKYDFIPGASTPARITDQVVIGKTPPESIGDQPLIGSYGPAWVAENTLIPAGYVACVASGGANSSFNPVAFREHQQSSLHGLNIVPGGNPDYPLQDSYLVRGLGAGVRHRGAAAILQVVTGTTYTAPTF